MIIFLFQVWFQNRRAKFRRNERSALSTSNSKGLFSMVGGGGGGNQCNSDSSDVSASISGSQFHSLHPGGEKTTIEQPVLAKSSVTSTGQSIPSYATIWRPDNMSKYAVIGSSAAANYRGKGILTTYLGMIITYM